MSGFTRSAAGRIWGSAEQHASVQKAAEASALARRKMHPDGPKPRGKGPAPVSGRAAEMVARARGTHKPAELPTPAWKPGQGKPKTPEQWAAWEHYQAVYKTRMELEGKLSGPARRAEQRAWLDSPHESVPHATRREAISVERYTHNNEGINNALRTGQTLTDEQEEQRRDLDKVLANNTLTEPVTVQRVITHKAAREAILANLDNPDFRYSDPGYTSMELKGTSPSHESMAKRYSGGSGNNVRHDEQIFIEAELPPGTHAFDMTQLGRGADSEMGGNSFLGDEHEYLLPRGATWKIDRVLPSPGSPAPLVKMTLVLDTPPAGQSMANRLTEGVRKRPKKTAYTAAEVPSGGRIKKAAPRRGGIQQPPRDQLSRTGIDEDTVRSRDNLSSTRRPGARKGDALWRSKS